MRVEESVTPCDYGLGNCEAAIRLCDLYCGMEPISLQLENILDVRTDISIDSSR